MSVCPEQAGWVAAGHVPLAYSAEGILVQMRGGRRLTDLLRGPAALTHAAARFLVSCFKACRRGMSPLLDS